MPTRTRATKARPTEGRAGPKARTAEAGAAGAGAGRAPAPVVVPASVC